MCISHQSSLIHHQINLYLHLFSFPSPYFTTKSPMFLPTISIYAFQENSWDLLNQKQKKDTAWSLVNCLCAYPPSALFLTLRVVPESE